MSKKSAKASFLEKQDYLKSYFEEVRAIDYYRDVFHVYEDDCYIERSIKGTGQPYDNKPNPVLSLTCKKKLKDGSFKEFVRNSIMFADMSILRSDAYMNKFALCSMCAYSGKHKKAEFAYQCFGICIDLDGVDLFELKTLILGVEQDIFPMPNYIINSGHGLHLTYLFEVPVPLFKHTSNALNTLKMGLTNSLWTRETSTYGVDNRQYQSILQSYRMPDSCTKLATDNLSINTKKKYLVTAYIYRVKHYTITELNHYVNDKFKYKLDTDDFSCADEEHLSLAKAKELYPKWYQRRIIEKKAPSRWTCNEGLYNWWFNMLKNNAIDGCRYYCVAYLFIFAIKCDLPFERAYNDACSLLGFLDSLTVHEDNNFTMKDIKSASMYYDENYVTYSIKAIESKTKIHIERNVRKFRKQKVHLQLARATQEIINPNWRDGNGRKAGHSAERNMILEYIKMHPDAKAIDCVRDDSINVCRKTVYRWWKDCYAECNNKTDDVK